jgi:hypothetical protein
VYAHARARACKREIRFAKYACIQVVSVVAVRTSYILPGRFMFIKGLWVGWVKNSWNSMCLDVFINYILKYRKIGFKVNTEFKLGISVAPFVQKTISGL